MNPVKFSDYLCRGEANVLRLKDREFVGKVFSDFVLRPAGLERVEIVNVSFKKCHVTSGVCVIRKGVSLKNVLMSDFFCSGGFVISSEVDMDNVVISSEEVSSKIVVSRQSDAPDVKRDSRNIDLALDISSYLGEVSITGIPSRLVSINPDRHVVVNADLASSVDWKSDGLSPLSYWKLMARKVLAEKADEGIFSIPSEAEGGYSQAVLELGILRDKGVVC